VTTPLAIFCRNYGPYHIDRLRALTNYMKSFVAVEIASQEHSYLWRPDKTDLGFDLRTLFDGTFEGLGNAAQWKRAIEILEEVNPEVVLVVGYSDAVMRDIAVWAKKCCVPCIMTTDTTRVDRTRSWWKELAKRWWIRRYFDALFLPGERSVAYFCGLGFPEARIWRKYHVADNDFYQHHMEIVRSDPESWRRNHDLPEKYFVTVCRLSPEKNIIVLLDAFHRYRNEGGQWDLVIVGGGPQEEEIRSFQESRQIRGVHFTGWKQRDEIPVYFALASCFVLASISEPWGVVVNEAAACGLPLLVSRNCGSAPELCQRGVNGYDFDPRSSEELTRRMLALSSGNMDLEEMSRASLRIAAGFTLDSWCRSLCDCIATVVAEKANGKRN
jgi:glycosyltransferase involved in cell wall biosynthesis